MRSTKKPLHSFNSHEHVDRKLRHSLLKVRVREELNRVDALTVLDASRPAMAVGKFWIAPVSGWRTLAVTTTNHTGDT